MQAHALRLARTIVGWVLVVAGAIIAPTPIPFGIPMMIVAVVILAYDSSFIRKRLRWLRIRFPRVNGHIDAAHPHMPAFVRRVMDMTTPLRVRLARRRAAASPAPEPPGDQGQPRRAA